MNSQKHLVFYPPSNAACMAFTPDRYYIPGLGGAEASLVILAPELVRMGWRVTIFNSAPFQDAVFEGVTYTNRANLTAEWLMREKPDIFCFYRAPSPEMESLVRMSCDAHLIAFSTDQATEGNYRLWFSEMELFICISEYHRNFLVSHYGVPSPYASRFRVIDLPIKSADYAEYNHAARGHKLLWSSQPERGLQEVGMGWAMVREAVPDAELYITASRRLWGVPYEGNNSYRVIFQRDEGVHFLSDIPRTDLVRIQKSCALQVSSLTYEELFCVSVMEGQASGLVPVVGTMGALPTTQMGGSAIQAGPNMPYEWAEAAIWWLKSPNQRALGYDLHQMALGRCSEGVIARQWDETLRALL